jgi:cytochrome P450
LPVIVIAELLGVPTSMRAQFIEWGNLAATTLDPALPRRDYATADRALRRIHAWLTEHVRTLRRRPGDDLLSRLVQLADRGDALTDTEVRATAFLLLGAGFETTVNLIGNGAALLMQHREQLDELLSGNLAWSGAVEETLRFDSPVQVTLRTARTDTEVAGVPLPAGRSIVVMLGGANRDPAVFTEPHRFDAGRANAREHLAFSAGIHYCLGAQLARLEGEIALRCLFEHAPELATAGPVRRRGTRVLRGYDRLPVAQPASSASRRSRNRRSTSLDVSTNASS